MTWWTNSNLWINGGQGGVSRPTETFAFENIYLLALAVEMFSLPVELVGELHASGELDGWLLDLLDLVRA